MFGIETIFDSLPQFLIICLILATAEAVYVLLGFGAGLIAVGTMALLLPELKEGEVLTRKEPMLHIQVGIKLTCTAGRFYAQGKMCPSVAKKIPPSSLVLGGI